MSKTALLVSSGSLGVYACGMTWVNVGVSWFTVKAEDGSQFDRLTISAELGSLVSPVGVSVVAAADVSPEMVPFLVDAEGKPAPRWPDLFDHVSGVMPKDRFGKLAAVCGHAVKFGKRQKV